MTRWGRLHRRMSPRIPAVVVVLLGLLLMHGFSESASGATVRHAPTAAGPPAVAVMETMATASGEAIAAVVDPSGIGTAIGLERVSPDGASGPSDEDGGAEHSSMGLLGLCLALISIAFVALAGAGLRHLLRRRVVWLSTAFSVRPPPCRAPNLFALGVLRC